MSSDLAALTSTAVLCALFPISYGIAQSNTWGLRVSMGNREGPPPLPAWANRAIRAHRNLLENLPHFSVLVLVAVFTEHANALTALGAWGFFWARVLHGAVYIAGIPYVRTAAYLVGSAAEILILSQVFRAAA